MRSDPAREPAEERAAPRCIWCDYDLAGIPTEGLCPECGISIEKSRRFAFAGTPWQIRPSPRGFRLTARAVLLHPVRVWRTLYPDSENNALLLWAVAIGSLGLTISGLLAKRARAGFSQVSPSIAECAQEYLGILAVAIPSALLGTLMVLLCLYGIDSFVRRLATFRRQTPPKAHASQVLDHAALGFTAWCAVAWALTSAHFLLASYSGVTQHAGRISEGLALLAYLGFLHTGCLIWIGNRHASRPLDQEGNVR
jgi:hypothetical protein